jgi:hypothetical protein
MNVAGGAEVSVPSKKIFHEIISNRVNLLASNISPTRMQHMLIDYRHQKL